MGGRAHDADDGHRLRRIEFRGVNTIQGITSRNRVSTVSGGAISGKMDGMAEDASYNEPKGVTMAACRAENF